jgi:hypothetical protein
LPTHEQDPELQRIRSQLAGDAAAALGWLVERVEEWRTEEPELCPGAPESKPTRRALRPPVGARCRRPMSDHGVGHGPAVAPAPRP